MNGLFPRTWRICCAATAARRNPRGFTLLELLVAIALSGLLVGAVYASLDLYWRHSVAGRADVERAQIVRAVLRRIELDLRSLVYHPPATAGSGSGTAGGGSGSTDSSSSGSGSTEDASETVMMSPEDASATTTSGLFGNATTLTLHVSRLSRELAFSPLANPQDAQSRTSELRIVTYFLSANETGSLPSQAQGTGLARMEGDRMALATAEIQSDLSATASQTSILTSQIVGLQFQYFDGLNWRSDWDSTVLGGPPRAVEVLIEMRQPVAAGNRLTAGRPAVEPSVHRLVVAIPSGKPIDTSAIQQ